MNAAAYFEDLATCGREAEATTLGGSEVPLDQALADCVTAIRCAGTVHLLGNGGGSCVAAHAENDLVKAAGIRAKAHQAPALLTAYANDDGYQNVYAQPLRTWLQPSDLLIAVSSSGRSDNMLYAVNVAREHGVRVITFSGFEPSNRLRSLGDLNFYVPSMKYGYVEQTHGSLLHLVTDELSRA